MTRKRDYGFMLYLSEQEKKALKKYADKSDMSQARYVREALKDKLGNEVNKTIIIKKK